MTKYREYDARYQELQAKVDALEAEKRNRQGRVKRFEVFIQALKKQQGELSDFDDDTWLYGVTKCRRPCIFQGHSKTGEQNPHEFRS